MSPVKPRNLSQNDGIPNLYLNMEHLLNMAHGERGILSTLVEKSILSLEESRLTLEQTIKNNPVGFRRELHKLKGSLGIIEPQHLYGLCRDLERNFLTLNEDERTDQSRKLLQGITFLIQELKGVSLNDN